MKNVVLIWQSYQTKEYIPIGILSEHAENKFKWQFLPTAKDAEAQGCFLPFQYSEEVREFDTLPMFFTRRIASSPFARRTFDIDVVGKSQLDMLAYSNSRINNDNFQIMTEQEIRELAEKPSTRKM